MERAKVTNTKKTKTKLPTKEKQKAEKEVLAGWKCVSPYMFKAPSKDQIYSIY